MQVGSVHGEISIDGSPYQVFDNILTDQDFDMPSDEIRKILGDGEARVSVSMNLRDSDFGKGHGVNVSVTLSCSQTRSTLDKAADLAQDLAIEYSARAFEKSQELFEAFDLGDARK